MENMLLLRGGHTGGRNTLVIRLPASSMEQYRNQPSHGILCLTTADCLYHIR